MLEFPGTVGGPWSRYIDPTTIPAFSPRSPDRGDDGGPGANNTLRAKTSSPSGDGGLNIGNANEPPRIGTVKYPRLVAKNEEAAKELKKRTLTNLYNQRPTWLDHAHRQLDAAVFAAYGWPPDLTEDDLLARLLALNLERSRNV